MKSHSGMIALILAVTIPIIIGTVMIVRSQNPASDDPKTQQLQKVNNDVPIADLNEPLPDNAQERARRQKLNKARNGNFPDVETEKRFKFTENSDSSYGLLPTHAPNEPAIPAKESAVVIIGKVTGGKAYLSEDKTSIYSEFEISQIQVLKNTSPENLDKGRILISRGGGAVRLPSGRIIYRYMMPKPMPKLGRLYFFFLKYSPDTEFSIITAYELTEAGIEPLDGLLPNGTIVHELSGQQSFKGTLGQEFFNQVKEAIEKNLNITRKGGVK